MILENRIFKQIYYIFYQTFRNKARPIVKILMAIAYEKSTDNKASLLREGDHCGVLKLCVSIVWGSRVVVEGVSKPLLI